MILTTKIGKLVPCQSERSEESPALAREWLGTQILRFAQNDMPTLPVLVGKIHHRRGSR